MKHISNLLSLILISILLLSPPLTHSPITDLVASASSSAPIAPAQMLSTSSSSGSLSLLNTPGLSDSTHFIFTIPSTTSSALFSADSSADILTCPLASSHIILPAPSSIPLQEDTLLEELLSLLPAHFTAHYIAASEEINGSLYTEELVRTHGIGSYDASSYIGHFANICNCDLLCSSLILNKDSAYFLDCDTLVSLDLNDVVAAFPMHDILLIPTQEHLADAAIEKAASIADHLLTLSDQNATIVSNAISPSDLTITCKNSALNIITLDSLDTPGTLTIECQKDSALIIRTPNTSFHKTLTIQGVPKALIFLLTSDTFQTDECMYGTILAPNTSITLGSTPFYGSILCHELISSGILNGATLSSAPIPLEE